MFSVTLLKLLSLSIYFVLKNLMNEQPYLTLNFELNMFVLIIEEELHAHYWNNKAKQALHSALNVQARANVYQAKNLILFLGDGESSLPLKSHS